MQLVRPRPNSPNSRAVPNYMKNRFSGYLTTRTKGRGGNVTVNMQFISEKTLMGYWSQELRGMPCGPSHLQIIFHRRSEAF
ncbi:hypothetical protein CDL15_Pgr025856 [Punica granatum]|uniref:Uncharacterized protein n=1 Tax=Punica granatum TaxID=22663 RepID=A0A218WAV5_PUNGR|nr:hypothetical protein CDL15_Pgr025856 [Punica granatum]